MPTHIPGYLDLEEATAELVHIAECKMHCSIKNKIAFVVFAIFIVNYLIVAGMILLSVPFNDLVTLIHLPTNSLIHDLIDRFIILMGVLMFSTSLVVWWLVRKYFAPITATIQLLDELVKRESIQVLPIVRYDEIGYLLKSFNTLIKELAKREKEISSLVHYDTLTKLPNRRLIEDRLSQTLAKNKRNDCYTGLMFMDLDNFKALNDTHGHQMGDLLLQQTGQRLFGCVRETDTVSRFGGDEFVVLLDKVGSTKEEAKEAALVIAEKIRASISKPYLLSDTVKHKCTVSIGVVLMNGSAPDIEELFKSADIAMYEAKKAGKNQIHFSE